MVNKAYDAIAQSITEMLDNGVVPWRRPWTVTGEGPTNVSSKKPYGGGNWFHLGLVAHVRGYGSNYWGTYKQIKDLGGQVRKGERSVPCTWYSSIPAKDADKQPIVRDGEQVFRRIAKCFLVFNIEQCDGMESFAEEPGEATRVSCKEIFEAMPHRPTVNHGVDRAYYRPSDDVVGMPNPSRFETESHYWATVFHELAHSTGHSKRLGRHDQRGWDARFVNEAYSEEELVSEFASSFLCGVSGIECQTVENAAAYIASWRKALAKNPNAVAKAITQASKAADYVLGMAAA